MTGVALALLVILGGKPSAARGLEARPNVGRSLEGCEIHGPAFGLDRIIRCENVLADVYPPIPAALEKQAVSELAQSYAAMPDQKEVVSAAEVELSTTRRTALRYLRKRPDGRADFGLVISLPAGKGLVRLVHCTRGLESPCYRVLEHLLTAVPAPSAPSPAGPPAIAGRALEVPKGCTRKGPTQLACGATELAWAPLYAGAPETLADVEPFIRRAHLHLGALEGSDRYCTLEQAEALCRVATLKGKDGRRRSLAYGFANVRGERLFVSCATGADLSRRLPEPCAQVMAFKDPQ